MSELIDYYSGYDEDARLGKSNLHKTEYLTTIHYFDKVISSGRKVLDVSAGAGKYSFYLANRGNFVTAGDIVPKHIDIIEEKNSNSVNKVKTYLGDARELSFEPDTFDAVLCMGALYHLKKIEDREKVVKACLKVLKKDGICAFAYINRFAAYNIDLNNSATPIDWGNLDNILHNGCCSYEKTRFFYYSSPDEIEKLMHDNDVEKMFHIGVDGIGYQYAEKLRSMNEEDYNRWWEHHITTCENEHLLGYSLHGLFIGRKC